MKAWISLLWAGCFALLLFSAVRLGLFNSTSIRALHYYPAEKSDSSHFGSRIFNDDTALSQADKNRALALSVRPEIVGEELLKQESEGFRALPKEAIENFRNERVFPASVIQK